MKLFKKHTAGMRKYKEFKKCIGMIGKIEETQIQRKLHSQPAT